MNYLFKNKKVVGGIYCHISALNIIRILLPKFYKQKNESLF